MQLTIKEARDLAESALQAIGHSEEHARITADHLVDAALRGVTFGSLPRILAIAERMKANPDHRTPIKVVHETPVSALIDGGDNVGYVVGHRTASIAIEKAKQNGIAIVGANKTYYTGLFSYFIEMATRAGYVAMAAGNGPAMVAPYGATEGRVGTNPIAFGFPTNGDPIIWDIGTAAIMQGEVMMHKRLGEPLHEGLAYDKQGRPTTDPAAALEGAIRSWGGHRGSGLALVVQMLGMMCASPPIPSGLGGWGFLMVLMSPSLLMPAEQFKANVEEFAAAVRRARPEAGGPAIRMPFDRSAAERRRRMKEGRIEFPDKVIEQLKALCAKK